jgi:hypothetical protein
VRHNWRCRSDTTLEKKRKRANSLLDSGKQLRSFRAAALV